MAIYFLAVTIIFSYFIYSSFHSEICHTVSVTFFLPHLLLVFVLAGFTLDYVLALIVFSCVCRYSQNFISSLNSCVTSLHAHILKICFKNSAVDKSRHIHGFFAHDKKYWKCANCEVISWFNFISSTHFFDPIHNILIIFTSFYILQCILGSSNVWMCDESTQVQWINFPTKSYNK